jgi:hypothetical protein
MECAKSQLSFNVCSTTLYPRLPIMMPATTSTTSFRDSHCFMKENRAQDQDEDESQAHKRISVAQFELRHRCHPAKEGKKTGCHSTRDPGIKMEREKKN